MPKDGTLALGVPCAFSGEAWNMGLFQMGSSHQLVRGALITCWFANSSGSAEGQVSAERPAGD